MGWASYQRHEVPECLCPNFVFLDLVPEKTHKSERSECNLALEIIKIGASADFTCVSPNSGRTIYIMRDVGLATQQTNYTGEMSRRGEVKQIAYVNCSTRGTGNTCQIGASADFESSQGLYSLRSVFFLFQFFGLHFIGSYQYLFQT